MNSPAINIEINIDIDNPLYNLKYTIHDLPLDPAKELIDESLLRLRYRLPNELKADFYLNSEACNDQPNDETNLYILKIIHDNRMRQYKESIGLLDIYRNRKRANNVRKKLNAILGYKVGDEFNERTQVERYRDLKRLDSIVDCILTGTSENLVMKQPLKICSTNLKPNKPNKRDNQFVNGLMMIPRIPKQYYPNSKCPDEQKAIQLKKYQQIRVNVNSKFTESVRQIKQILYQQISVNYFENFPTNLIMKSFVHIFHDKTSYLQRAQDFIQQHLKSIPKIRAEIALCVFLTDAQNGIKPTTAMMLIILLFHLQQDYRTHLKQEIIEKLARNRQTKSTYRIEENPPEFPLLLIKAPLPWSEQLKEVRHRMQESLMIAHPILQTIRNLWFELYGNYVVCDNSKFAAIDSPQPFEFARIVADCCTDARQILIDDWLPRVSNIVTKMVQSNKQLISKRKLCANFYSSLYALMSHLVENLIYRSIVTLFDLIRAPTWSPTSIPNSIKSIKIKCVGMFHSCDEGNEDDINNQLYNECENDPNISDSVTECPRLLDANSELRSEFVLNNSGKLYTEPNVDDVPESILNCFHRILNVGVNIPRMEYFLSQDPHLEGYLHYLTPDSGNIPEIFQQIKDVIAQNTTELVTALSSIYYQYLLLFNQSIKRILQDACGQMDDNSNPSVFEPVIDAIDQLKRTICQCPNQIWVNTFELDLTVFKLIVNCLLDDLIDVIIAYILFINQSEAEAICEDFEEISIRASDIPTNVAEMVTIQTFVNECCEINIFNLKNRLKNSVQRNTFLLSHTIMSEAAIKFSMKLLKWPEKIDKSMNEISTELAVVRKFFEKKLLTKCVRFKNALLGEEKKVVAFCQRQILDATLKIDGIKRNCMIVDELIEKLRNYSIEAQSINTDENLLQMGVTEFTALKTMIDAIDPVEQMWKIAYFIEKNFELWYYAPYEDLNGEEISTTIDTIHKTIMKVIKNLANNSEARNYAEKIRVKIGQFKMYVPILEVICQKGVNNQHWSMLSAYLERDISPLTCSSLCSLIESGIMDISDKLNEISILAAKEYDMCSLLTQMQVEWQDIFFNLSEYKDSRSYVLTALDDIYTLLDDHLLKSQGMQSGATATSIGVTANDWERKLNDMQTIIETWMQVQSMWMYLEPIFSSEDIMRQMPEEARSFAGVNRRWKQIMKSVKNDKHVLRSTDYPDLFATLQMAKNDLETIQKGLNLYLEKKRLFFSRFFFLSNDELLEILSETKDPTRVQPHMKKCFEGIHSLCFDDQMIITAMNSSDKETVDLAQPVDPKMAKGLVELWLKEIESVMLDSVRMQAKLAYENYFNVLRKQWVLNWPSQIVQLVSCAAWTREVEEAIGANQSLQDNYQKCACQIDDIVDLVRGTLSRGVTITIEALIVLDVHANDINKHLINKNVCRVDDFNWIAQLRYYWHATESAMDVNMLSTIVAYGWEYLGNVARLVVTPLTDRCFRTIMGAIKLNLGSAPEGPAGTGKTETCKDLAKAVGKKCIVFNCSDGLDYKSLGKMCNVNDMTNDCAEHSFLFR